MYKHSADSIRESSNKRFISKADKAKYDNYANIHRSKDDSYNREEIDSLLSPLEKQNLVIDEELPALVNNTDNKTINFIEMSGDTIQPTTVETITPEMESGWLSVNGPEDNEYRVRTIDFIPVKDKDVISVIGGAKLNFFIYDKNKNCIAFEGHLSSFTVPYGVEYIKYHHERNVTHSISISRTHLDQILSVGELQEDGTYKIPLTVHGKNIMEHEWEQGTIYYSSGSYINSNNSTFTKRLRSKNFIPLDTKQTHITYSTVINSRYKAAIRFFDENYNIIKVDQLNGFIPDMNKYIIQIPPTATYVKFIIASVTTSSDGQQTGDDDISPDVGIGLGIQFEYGTEKTEYEPYNESVMDIYSPVKLCKVDGGIREGIESNKSDVLFINERGRLCIEKNIDECILSGDSTNRFERFIRPFEAGQQDIKTRYYTSSIFYDKIEWYHTPISSFTKGFNNMYYNDIEGCQFEGTSANLEKACFRISIYKERLVPYNNDINEYLKANPIKMLYVKKEPEIIELDTDLDLLLAKSNQSIIRTKTLIQPSNIKCDIPLSCKSTIESNNKNIYDLKKEVSNIANTVSTNSYKVEFENGSCNLVSEDGYVDEVIIEGKSYRSCINPSAFDPNADRRAHWINIHEGFKISADGFLHINKTDSSRYANFFLKPNSLSIKPNTDYTLIVEVVKNTLTPNTIGNNYDIIFGESHHIDESLFKYNLKIKSGFTGIVKKLLPTRNDFTNTAIGCRGYIQNTCNGEIKFRYMYVEGDLTKEEFCTNPFTGIRSVGSTENGVNLITSTPNLINIHNCDTGKYNLTNMEVGDNYISSLYPGQDTKVTNFKDMYRLVDVINTIPGKTYKISANVSVKGGVKGLRGRLRVAASNNISIGYTKGFDNDVKSEYSDVTFIARESKTYIYAYALSNNGSETIEPGECYCKWENVMVTEVIGDSTTYYVEHKSVNTFINLSNYGIEGGLKSLPDGTCDRIFKSNDKYYLEQRVGIINITEEQIMNNLYNANIYDSYMVVGITTTELGITNIQHGYTNNLLCSTFPRYLTSGENSFSIFMNINTSQNQTVYFSIPSAFIGNLNLENAKNYLLSNKPIILYPLKTPRVIELKEDLNIRIYNDKTNVYVESTPIYPKVSLSKKQGLQNVVSELQNKIRNLSRKNIPESNLLLKSIYNADYSNYSVQVLSGFSISNGSVDEENYDDKLFELFATVISAGKHNYIYEEIEHQIDFFTIIDKLSFEMSMVLFDLLDEMESI